MPGPSLTIFSGRVCEAPPFGPANIVIEGGRIAAVERGPKKPGALDLSAHVVMPGLVDTHVHVNEPGRTDWEGFETATRAAAAGGITTIVAMPLNCTPAATSRAALLAEAAAAQGKCVVDYGLWGGVVPGNTGQLAPMWEAGALGFKCFLSPSGVDDFGHVSAGDLEQAYQVLAHLKGAVLLAHAEDPALLATAPASRRYADYLASRPPEAEVEAIRLLMDLCRRYRVPTHIVHVATEQALPLIRAARQEGLPLTAETCPHYLTFDADTIPDGATLYKCAPPIRSHASREALWNALADGTLDLIASDHSPCPPAMKGFSTGDFSIAWGGIASLELSFPVVQAGGEGHSIGLDPLAGLMASGPAHLAGLQGRKGRIAPGYDADLFAFDPDTPWTVDQDLLYHRHKPTPYHGMQLRGRIAMTFLRGIKVFDRSQPNPFPQDKPGQWLKRTSNPLSTSRP